jgi:mRNA interferase RelE/StbE
VGLSGRKLKIADETAKLVRSLHPNLKRKIKSALQAIIVDPRTGKVLKDELEGLRSFRVGKFRVIYKISSKEGIIEIIAIGPRKKIYEETLRLLRKDR